jgi:hypothetical protein
MPVLSFALLLQGQYLTWLLEGLRLSLLLTGLTLLTAPAAGHRHRAAAAGALGAACASSASLCRGGALRAAAGAHAVLVLRRARAACRQA